MIRLRFFLFSMLLAGYTGLIHADDNTVVAKIAGQTLTEGQMNKDLAMPLYKMENNIYQLKRSWIENKGQEIVFDKAAKEAGMSRQKWEQKEIDAKVTAPTQQEIQQVAMQINRTAPNSPEVIKQATDWLVLQKKNQQRNLVYQQTVKKYPFEVLLPEPKKPNIEITYNSNNPVKGPDNAPVTIIEFTDYQCPWCRRSQPYVKAAEDAYPGKIKVVTRQFPLVQIHPRAFPSAEAALCAKEQGKYWPYRDKLFDTAHIDMTLAANTQQPLPPEQLQDADLLRYAKEVGLNQKKFEQCVATHKYDEQIQADMTDGQKFGVGGTPAFFVNGKDTSFYQLKDAVKDQLAGNSKK